VTFGWSRLLQVFELSEFLFELNGRLLADRKVRPAGVVNDVDEGSDHAFGIFQALIGLAVAFEQ
jgi:hypothetical protein